jgi:transposase
LIARETHVSDPLLDRQVRRRLAVLRPADEVTGNVALTRGYFGISRQLNYTWLRRYQADGPEGLRARSRRPKTRKQTSPSLVNR